MLSIPTDLHNTKERPSIETEGVTVIDYVATDATLSMRVAVTRPTLVFVHEGLKELSSGPVSARPSAPNLTAPAGHVVAMRTGAHLMSDLLPLSASYRSTIVSVERTVLQSLLGSTKVAGDSPAAASTPIAAELLYMAGGLRARVTATDDVLERRLATRELLIATLLERPLRNAIAADLDGWGPSPHDRIYTVIERHKHSALSLPDYAAMSAMSVSSFTRHFRDAYGESPGRWLTEARLARAATLLHDTDQSITDVCALSGFGDLSNFIRSFNKRFDMSPSAYRSMHEQRRAL